MMAHWVHDISRHSLGEIVSLMERHGHDRDKASESVLFCDQEGACFFDESADPYQKALKEILDMKGREGWELVQMAFREKEIICFWKKREE